MQRIVESDGEETPEGRGNGKGKTYTRAEKID